MPNFAQSKISKLRPKDITPRVPIQTPFFDEEGNISRPWVLFFEQRDQGEDADTYYTPKAVFNISGTETGPALDPGPRREILTQEDGFIPTYIRVDCRVCGATAVLDILHSDDDGATWQSIFEEPAGDTSEWKIQLSAKANSQCELAAFRSGLSFAQGDLLRQDVLSGQVTDLATHIEMGPAPDSSEKTGIGILTQPQNSGTELIV